METQINKMETLLIHVIYICDIVARILVTIILHVCIHIYIIHIVYIYILYIFDNIVTNLQKP